MKWKHHLNGCTGCSEWWEGYTDELGGHRVEVMFCTGEMHLSRDIPEGWVYYHNYEYGWQSFPDNCTTPEECMAYADMLIRMEGEIS